MRFVDNIGQLGYYTHNAPIPCYCEILLNANDLMLQGQMTGIANSGYIAGVYVYSADGLTQYEDATSFFNVYYFAQGTSRYFNLNLKSFSPAMCAYGCWILKVIITLQIGSDFITVFSKLTDRYCQPNCCEVPSGITVDQNDVDVLTPASTSVMVDDCGNQYITVKAVFTCYSLELNQYFGIPPQVIQGSASFGYSKTLNLKGRIVERPRTINRQVSFNCTLQRTETFIPYLLEQTEVPLLPAWKMQEVEDMFTADYLYVNGNEYQFAGGEIFEQLNVRWELFKLKTTVQGCITRQTFGCSIPCSGDQSLSFLIPSNYSGGFFYDENRQLIAQTFDELLNWYSLQPNVSLVTDTSGDYDNTAYSFTVQFNGYLASSFYVGGTYPSNRIFGTDTPNAPIVTCALPDMGTPIIVDAICDDPDMGTPIITDVPGTDYTLLDAGNWMQGADSKIIISGHSAKIALSVTNTTMGSTGDIVQFNDVIGYIPFEARPLEAASFSNTASGDIPAGNYVLFNTDGSILYSGTLMVGASNTLTITINNLFYGT